MLSHRTNFRFKTMTETLLIKVAFLMIILVWANEQNFDDKYKARLIVDDLIEGMMSGEHAVQKCWDILNESDGYRFLEVGRWKAT